LIEPLDDIYRIKTVGATEENTPLLPARAADKMPLKKKNRWRINIC